MNKFNRSTRLALAKLNFRICLIILAVLPWIFYVPFVNGDIPGIYPLALFYGSLGLLGILLCLLFPLILVVDLILAVSFASTPQASRLTIPKSLWLLLIILALLPALNTFDLGHSLIIKPWWREYRTAYTSYVLDDNYGDGLIFKCDVTGILCWLDYRYPSTVIGIEGQVLDYNSQQGQFSVTSKGHLLYLRSRQKTICKDNDRYVPLSVGCGPYQKNL